MNWSTEHRNTEGQNKIESLEIFCFSEAMRGKDGKHCQTTEKCFVCVCVNLDLV